MGIDPFGYAGLTNSFSSLFSQYQQMRGNPYGQQSAVGASSWTPAQAEWYRQYQDTLPPPLTQEQIKARAIERDAEIARRWLEKDRRQGVERRRVQKIMDKIRIRREQKVKTVLWYLGWVWGSLVAIGLTIALVMLLGRLVLG